MPTVKQIVSERCEGWRRHGGVWTFGPVKWEQCTNEAEVMLTVKQEGKKETLPACKTCWQEAIDNEGIEIISAAPIGPKQEADNAHENTDE